MITRHSAIKVAVFLCCSCLLSGGAGAQVYLRNLTTRLVYGPFDPGRHDQVVLPRGTYACAHPNEDEIAVTKLLRSTIIMDVNFQSTNLMAVLNYSTNYFVSTNVVTFRVDTNNYEYQAGIPAFCSITAEWKKEVPRVSFVGSVSMFRLLEYLSETTWLPVNIEKRVVTLSQAGHTIVPPGILTEPGEDKGSSLSAR